MVDPVTPLPDPALTILISESLLASRQTHTQVLITDAQRRVTWVNPAFTQVTGYHLHEILGRIPGEFLQGPDTDPDTIQTMREALRTQHRFAVEVLNYTRSGTPYWNHLEVMPIFSADGSLTHFLSLQRDITSRRQTERELTVALAELRRTTSLFEAAGRIGNIGQWQVFLDNRPPRWSETTYLIHGMEPGTPVTLENAIQYYLPEHHAMIREVVAACIRDRQPFEFEALLQPLQGPPIWVKSTGEPLLDETGSFTSIHGVIQNIDRQKRAMLALEERDRRLTGLSQNVPGALFQFRMGEQGHFGFPFLSETFLAILSIPDKFTPETLAEIIQQRIPSTEWQRLQPLFIHSREQLQSFRAEFPYHHPAQGLRWLRVASTPTRDDLGYTTWHAYLEDVTDLKQIEEQLRETAQRAETANVAKSVFLSNMSHEIRTPLNAVVGMAELLETCQLNDEAKSYLSIIRNSSQALLGLIEDILDFSKIEAGEIRLSPQPTDLTELVETCLAMVAESARQKSIELAFFIDPQLPPRILADPARLRQVLLNLLSNAIKFTTQGHVRVLIEALPQPQTPSHSLRLTVADTGVGIDPVFFPKLFQRFSQIHDMVNRPYGGTGLGLAICHRLVDLMGGSIHVDSALGQGARFHVDLPLPEHTLQNPRPNPNLSQFSALLIHGQSQLRELYARHLRALGLTVLQAQNLDSFRAQTSLQPPDLLVLDLIHPDHDLDHDIHQLRLHLQQPQLPVLVLSWKPYQLRTGPSPTVVSIPKPLVPTVLLQHLSRLLNPGSNVPSGASGDLSKPPEPGANKPSTPRANLRILVAEDNAVNRRVLALLLEKLGYSCDLAENGSEAVEAARNGTYDVILMDMQMPVLDGLQATRQIRSLLPPPVQPRIYAVTANATEDDRAACIQAGMDGYLSKPIRAADLAQTLDHLFPRYTP